MLAGMTTDGFVDWRDYAYTVGELREELADLPDDMVVILEKDAEGNGYGPLSAVNSAWYEPDSIYSGERRVGRGEWSTEEYSGDSWDEYIRGAVPALILGPVN